MISYVARLPSYGVHSTGLPANISRVSRRTSTYKAPPPSPHVHGISLLQYLRAMLRGSVGGLLVLSRVRKCRPM